MQSTTFFLLIFVAILALPANTKKTFRFPLKREHANTTNLLYRRETEVRYLHHYGSRFVTSVDVGTPRQTFNLVFDSGFPNIIIADDWCTNCGNPPSIPRYNGGASSTFKDLNQVYDTWGNFHGGWTSDIFYLLDFTIERPFARGYQVPGEWVQTAKYSGYLGLGLHTTDTQHNTLIEHFDKNDLLTQKLISCRLVKNNDESAGDILFGDIEEKYIDGELQKISVTSGPTDSAWIIPILDIEANSRSFGGGSAAITTGLTTIYLSDSIVTQIYSGTAAARQSDGIWAVPDPFPYDISFFIGDGMFTVPKDDIPVRQFPYGNLFRGAIQVTEFSVWALGTPFIQNHYVVYDYTTDNVNVGIGKRKS